MIDLKLWLGVCIMAIVEFAIIAVLFAVTWQKIDLIYDIVRKKKWDGNGHG